MNENPWHHLPDEPPYVLPEDKDEVLTFNKAHQDDYRRLDLELIPEPFVGNPHARLVLLGNNPGFKTLDKVAHKRKPAFRERMRNNLLHRLSDAFPFLCLDPDLDISPPGNLWWESKLKSVLAELGNGDNAKSILARDVLAVEYFPYASHRFRHGKLARSLYSQQYSIGLVRNAMKDGAVIVLTRGKSRWLKAIPELEKYHRLVRLKNVMRAPISSRNCCDDGWSHIQDVVRTIKARLP